MSWTEHALLLKFLLVFWTMQLSHTLQCKHGTLVRFQSRDEERCRCDKGWVGKRCDRPLRCENGHFDSSKSRCICDEGYKGLKCNKKLLLSHETAPPPSAEDANCTGLSSNSTIYGCDLNGLSHGAILAILICVFTFLLLILIGIFALFLRRWIIRKQQRKQLRGINLRAPYSTQTVLNLSPAVIRIAATNDNTERCNSENNSMIAASTSSQNALLDQTFHNCV